MKNTYNTGLDALGGDGLLDMIPGLNVVSKLTSGGQSGTSTSPSASAATSAAATQEAIKKALAEEKARRDQEKAEAEARTTRYILFGVLGLVGLGGVVFLLRKN